MNEALYRTAMDKVTVSGKLEEETIAMIIEKTPMKTKSHKMNFRFVPVLTAAVVFIFGTAAVTAQSVGFEWFKGLFENNDFELTEEISNVLGEMKNFSCEESVGLKLSPIGMAADETEIYCTFNVDNIAEGFSKDDIRYIEILSFSEEKQTPVILGVGYSDRDSTLTALCSFSEKALRNNERIKMRIGIVSEPHAEKCGTNPQPEIYTDISFDVDLNDVKYLETEYDTPVTAIYESQEISVEKITVTPLHLLLYCNDNKINDCIHAVINLKDGTVVSAVPQSSVGSLSDNVKMRYSYDFMFDNPIDPENIVSIYLGDDCIYDSAEK